MTYRILRLYLARLVLMVCFIPIKTAAFLLMQYNLLLEWSDGENMDIRYLLDDR